jgi:hypothetical protein
MFLLIRFSQGCILQMFLSKTQIPISFGHYSSLRHGLHPILGLAELGDSLGSLSDPFIHTSAVLRDLTELRKLRNAE